MPYQSELALLSETFGKSHIAVHVLPTNALAQAIEQNAHAIAPSPIQYAIPSLPTPKARERYHLMDGYDLCHIYLLLPNESEILLIGPYLSHPMQAKDLPGLAERLGLSPEMLPRLAEYAATVPVLEQESPLFFLLDTFCEHIWHSPSFSIVDVNQPTAPPASPIHSASHTDKFDDVLLDMKTMEQRYAFENELIRAVVLGQLHLESRLFSGITQTRFEQRVFDQLRNAKNYCIIMNTLLRKAAEQGGVHPLYIDRVSSDFARRIEKMKSLAQSTEMMSEIFRGYCLLVQQHSLQKYSKVVQTTILLIDSDLAADLTLHSLAQNQGISPGYLSTVFKKETGCTVTAYIRDKRMRYARHLLVTTNLQVQTVAMHCGILDVHFFSKLFKKETGMTPRQYRESHPC